MLIFAKARLTYLAVPKTGSTAVEMALRPKADVVFAKRRKHVTAQRFHAKVAPFLADAFGIETETVAVMRDPVEQIRSWYRYRAREDVAEGPRDSSRMSFDDFLREVARDDPPEVARIGSQHAFLTGAGGDLTVDHLFAYEDQPAFLAFMGERLGTAITLKRKNVSPAVEAPMSPVAEAMIRAARAEEFALYDRLMAAGGYLGPG